MTPPLAALVVVVPKDKLTTSGPIKKWKGIADSGNAVYRWFCSECGSPIAHDPEAAPVIAIKGGTLDVEIKKGLKPVSLFFLSLFTAAFADIWGHRIPRFGRSASSRFARRSWRIRLSICRSREWALGV